MPIIRKKLFADEVYPTTIRYNSDTGTVQTLVNGTWTDSPLSDPRNQTTFPPRITSDPACDAAKSVEVALKNQIDGVLTAIDGSQTAFTIAGLILSLFSFGVFAIFIDIALFIAHLMLDAGTAAINSALTSAVYDTLTCILFCHMDSSGRLNPGELGAVESDINGQIGGLGATILNAMLNLAGEGGINNLAALGMATGDCSDCACNQCANIDDWVGATDANHSSWATEIERGTNWITFESIHDTIETGEYVLWITTANPDLCCDMTFEILSGTVVGGQLSQNCPNPLPIDTGTGWHGAGVSPYQNINSFLLLGSTSIQVKFTFRSPTG